MIRSIAIGLVVGAIFLGLALWGVPLDQVGEVIARMDPLWLLGPGLLLNLRVGAGALALLGR